MSIRPGTGSVWGGLAASRDRYNSSIRYVVQSMHHTLAPSFGTRHLSC